VAKIEFCAKVDVSEEVAREFDADYYMYQINADHVAFQVKDAIYANLDFTVEFDEDFISEEDVWYNICGEFDRPYRTDGGEEF